MGFFDLLNFKKEGKDGKSFFWETMEKCDWQFEGNDEKVLEPVISYLSEQSDELIFQFEDVMSELLFNLDTRNNFNRCKEVSGYDSDDMFLYSRCVALINGKDYYRNIINNGAPDEIWNMEFEALLYVPQEAWSIKHNADSNEYPHISPLSYETGSNEQGWK